MPLGAGGRADGRRTDRGQARREAILQAAGKLFAERGYAAVGMNDIGAAAGVTGPAVYRHFDSKSALVTAAIEQIITLIEQAAEAVSSGPPAQYQTTPSQMLAGHIQAYAAVVAGQRSIMAVFVREVHHLPPEYGGKLRERQRALVATWTDMTKAVHPDWPDEHARVSVHACFGLLNTVGTFTSRLSDDELAQVLGDLAASALLP